MQLFVFIRAKLSGCELLRFMYKHSTWKFAKKSISEHDSPNRSFLWDQPSYQESHRYCTTISNQIHNSKLVCNIAFCCSIILSVVNHKTELENADELQRVCHVSNTSYNDSFLCLHLLFEIIQRDKHFLFKFKFYHLVFFISLINFLQAKAHSNWCEAY